MITQRRREVGRRLQRAARSRPSNGREPLCRVSIPKTRFRVGYPTQRPALGERRPRHLSSSFKRWMRHALSPNNVKEKRQNRRAFGTAAGVKRCDDERSRSRFASFSPAAGDPRSPVVLPPISEITFQAQHLPLCMGGWMVGLRVFVSSWLRRVRASGSAFICVICGFSGKIDRAHLCDLWAVLSVSSVPLWFFGSQIPRSA